MTPPPLTKSLVEISACPKCYVSIVIDGKATGESIPSERGSDIHDVMAAYVAHCARKKVHSDWAEFNRLAAASGPDAGPQLDGIRDNYTVQWQAVYGTEVPLALDEDFNPAYLVPDHDRYPAELPQIPGVEYSEELAAHIGRCDVIMISEDGKRAKIPDYKTGNHIFDADTYQAELYCFMLMKHLPEIEVVTFEQIFTAYRNCVRTVQWRRTDMPAMQATISRARERQRLTHADPGNAKALPCSACTYCPLAKDMSCPIAEWNEYTVLSPQARVMWAVWLEKIKKLNTPILKAYAEVHGPVRYEDGNGKVYEYGEQPVPSTRYPLDASAMEVLNNWRITTGENMLDGRLNISSTKLKGLLKAKKREALKEQFESSCIETGTKPSYKVRTPDGLLEEENPYQQED